MSLVNDVAAAIGMEEVTGDTVPTLAQVTHFVNIAIKQAVIERVEKMGIDSIPELMFEDNTGNITDKDVVGIIGVTSEINGDAINAEYILPSKYYSNVINNRVDKPVWTHIPPGANDGQDVSWEVSPSANPVAYYLRMPDDYDDTTGDPDAVDIPSYLKPRAMEIAVSYILLNDRRDEAAVYLNRKVQK